MAIKFAPLCLQLASSAGTKMLSSEIADSPSSHPALRTREKCEHPCPAGQWPCHGPAGFTGGTRVLCRH